MRRWISRCYPKARIEEGAGPVTVADFMLDKLLEVTGLYMHDVAGVSFAGASLAVAIGNAHGFYKGNPRLDFDRLAALAARVPVPLVLHGASGIPDADL